MKYVYAIWDIKALPQDLSEFMIQFGYDNEEGEETGDGGSFDYESVEAELLIESQPNGFLVTLTAYTNELLIEDPDYWLSPNQVGLSNRNNSGDAIDFGICKTSVILQKGFRLLAGESVVTSSLKNVC